MLVSVKAACVVVLTGLLTLTAVDSAGSRQATAQEPEAVKIDKANIQGTWLPQVAERDGAKLPHPETWQFNDSKAIQKAQDGSISFKVSYKLDPTKKPKAIDFTIDSGPHQGTVLPGIYELSGDTLRICYNFKAKERPADFATKANTGYTLFVLKRETPK